jgi:hypothetical protein
MFIQVYFKQATNHISECLANIKYRIFREITRTPNFSYIPFDV